MSFFGDLGTSLSDLFTGRWTGGETNLAHDNLTPLATLGGGLALGGLGAGALGAFGGLGAEAGAGALGAEAGGFGAAEAGGLGAEAGGSALGFAGPAEAGASSAFNPIAADFEALGYGPSATQDAFSAFNAASPAEMAGGGGGGVLNFGDLGGGAGGITNVADAGGGGGVFDTVSNFAGKAGDYAMAHPFQTLGVGAAAAGLGSALMRGQGTSANEQNIANMTSSAVQQAQYDTATGRELQEYFKRGTLPQGMQLQVDKMRKAARAAAISAAAKSGQNTNPQNNSQLQQAFEEADRNALIMATQLETQLFQQGTAMVQAGLDATKLSMSGYQFLTGVDQQKSRDVTNAMIALAGAFGGGKMNVNLGGSRNA